ncbi:hypothetical protein Ngar_c20570 [Candidatus Nitrososphaera gargensis Ga9.2]|uniref:DUF4760 domain-containing protein n=2 Tax=Candidatus Nitrososphaera gargensis TaxID=497727 RepID=K0IN96_NITGG|nr:hypothetical protein Ngar_c20570 [Candidatus Nitrososphaera gargensis Ga9.2]
MHCKAFDQNITYSNQFLDVMPIEWDVLVTEMAMLGTIIYSAIFVENWIAKRKMHLKEKEDGRRTIEFVANDLKKKIRFIDDSVQYKDFKPFFTDMWDAIILGGKQTVLPFELFENLQHTYSWMKYYNNELEQREKGDGEAVVMEILGEVKGSIGQSLKLLKEAKL